MMSLRPSFSKFGFYGVLVACFAGAMFAADRPNIILIMADDIGQEALSGYGSADYATPHLDALARSGVRFTQFHSQPLCTPTRVQIMTGQYNVRNYTKFAELRTTERTFGNDLRDAGYHTGIAGKWQLGRDRSLIDHFGFDEYCLWWLEEKSWRYGEVGDLIVNGEIRPGQPGEYGPEVVNDFVLDFIERKAPDDAPFFVYYPMILPHSPFVPTPLSAGEPDPREQDPAYFKDMVEYLDLMVGRVVQQLEASGERENTLIVFLGDNGTHSAITSRMTDGRVVQGGKSYTTNGGTHVPFIVSWPESAVAGLVSPDLVDCSDVLPTLHAAAGYEPAPDRVFDGFDLLPVLRGEISSPRKWSYCWYGQGKDGELEARDLDVTVFARTARYKLYRDGRFYDLSRDVDEALPLAIEALDAAAVAVHGTLAKVIAEFDKVEASR